MSGKNIKPNISYTENSRLPPLNKPNEEIQWDFIGLMTENNCRFHILLSIDRFSKWPAACFCTSTDGETAVNVLEQYINLNGVPKTWDGIRPGHSRDDVLENTAEDTTLC